MENTSENTKTIITQATKTNINNVTGEVLSTEEYSAMKVPQTPDFIMTFTQDIGFIANISGGASKLLFGILSEISRSNTIVLVKEIKERIAKKVGLNPNSINPLITNLVKNKVLLRENNNSRSSIYVINPYYFGKGKWVNINKLRMMVEYDFIQGKKTLGIETEYIDDKDDYIGQLIENQEAILKEAEKIRKYDGSIEIINNKKQIAQEPTSTIETEAIETEAVKEPAPALPAQQKTPAILDSSSQSSSSTLSKEELELRKIEMEVKRLELENKNLELKNKNLELETKKIAAIKGREASLFDEEFLPSDNDEFL